MYDMKFHGQTEATRRYLFGPNGQPPPPDVCAAYKLPSALNVIPCHKDFNDEWISDETQQKTPSTTIQP